MYEGAVNALDPDEFLTPVEVARITRLSVRTLSDRRWKGTGPAFIKLSPGKGGRIRYRRSDVTQWLCAQTVGVA